MILKFYAWCLISKCYVASGGRQAKYFEITRQTQHFKIRLQVQHLKFFRQTQFSVTMRIMSGIVYIHPKRFT